MVMTGQPEKPETVADGNDRQPKTTEWRPSGLPRELWVRKDVSPSEKFVLMTLASMAQGSGSCYARQRVIAQESGITERTLIRLLASLEAHGLIEVRKGGYEPDRRKNEYVLTFDRRRPKQHDKLSPISEKHDKLSPRNMTNCHEQHDNLSPNYMTNCQVSPALIIIDKYICTKDRYKYILVRGQKEYKPYIDLLDKLLLSIKDHTGESFDEKYAGEWMSELSLWLAKMGGVVKAKRLPDYDMDDMELLREHFFGEEVDKFRRVLYLSANGGHRMPRLDEKPEQKKGKKNEPNRKGTEFIIPKKG